MPSRLLSTLAILATLALAAALWLALSGERGLEGLFAGETRAEETTDAPPVAPAPSDATVDRTEVATPPDSTPAVVIEPEPEDESAPIPVRGFVLDEESGGPLEGAEVFFSGAFMGTAVATTGSSGEFELELTAETVDFGRYVDVTVRDANASLVLRTSIVLEPEVVLRVRAPLRLRGRLVCTPARDLEGNWVRISMPAVGALSTQLFAGTTELDAEGRFELEVIEPVRASRFLVVFGDMTSMYADALEPRETLASEEGALFERRLADLTLEVRTPDGDPVPGATVRLFPTGPTGTVRWNAFLTGAEGDADLALADGEYELCVGKPGFTPAVETFELDAEEESITRRVVLDPLREEDSLAGIVLSADGLPVEDAVVTTAPMTDNRDLSVAGVVQTRTDPDGRFRLAVAPDRAVDLSVFHRDHGFIERRGFVPGYLKLTLRFQPTGSLRVVPTGVAASGPTENGPLQYFLVGPDGDVASGHGGAPLVIGELTAGEYALYVRGPGGLAYGETVVTVPDRDVAVAEVELVEVAPLTGVVTGPGGAPRNGIVARVAHPGWPAELVTGWGRAVTDAEGRFRLFVGELRGAQVELWDGARSLGEYTLAAGTESNCALAGD